MVKLDRKHYYVVRDKVSAEKFINTFDPTDYYGNKGRLHNVKYPIYFRLCSTGNRLTFTTNEDTYKGMGLDPIDEINGVTNVIDTTLYNLTNWHDVVVGLDTYIKYKGDCEMYNILERFKKRAIEKLNVEMEAEMERTRLEDLNYGKVLEIKNSLACYEPTVRAAVVINTDDFEFNSLVGEKLVEISKKYSELTHEVLEKLEDVKSLLDIADTFDQKQQILVANGILNADNTLI